MTIANGQLAKQAAGKAAADLITDDMVVGLGTGSTAAYFIEHLIHRCQRGLKITATATSERSELQALKGGIPILDINHLSSIDVVVDGADEIDHQKRMIKGGGGALLREKIVAHMAREMIVIIDPSKLVDQLGSFPLPVEVVPFACDVTLRYIERLGYHGQFRRQPDGTLYLTDNSNYLIDIQLSKPLISPEQINHALRSIPGVVETGFFFNLAQRVIVGQNNGSIEVF